MKFTKLREKLGALMSTQASEDQKQIEALKEILKKAKRKSRELRRKAQSMKEGRKLREIQEKIEIISAQRKKGLELLKVLKEDSKTP